MCFNVSTLTIERTMFTEAKVKNENKIEHTYNKAASSMVALTDDLR